MRFRPTWLVSILVVALVVPALFFRGSIQPQTTSELNGLDQFVSMEAVSYGPAIWADALNNKTYWTIANAPPAALLMNGSLIFTVLFPVKSSAQSINMYRNLNLPLDENPVVTFSMSVSRGVSYGVRFYGVTPSNTSFVAWREGSDLQHRPGLGTVETVSANLSVESYLAAQKLPPPGSRITRVLLYLEATPLTGGKFSMTILKLQANPLLKTRAEFTEVEGTFKGMVADLGSVTLNQALFQIFVGLDIKGTPDLSYVPYFTRGVSVVAQGYTYVAKAATTYELALLSPKLVSSSPIFTGKVNSTSLIISARSGAINFVRLNSIAIRFFSTPSSQNLNLDPSSFQPVIFYYLLFLFVIPAAVVALLVRMFRDED